MGAVVAALIATGLTLAVDDEPRTTSTTTPPPVGVGADLDIRGLLDEVQPTVVSIYISQGGQTVGAGSGFVYDADEGLILTNAHVIEGAEDISVTFFDGSAQGADVEGAFPEDDLAMVRVPNTEGLREARLGSSDALQVGEDVVAIGNALGLGGDPTVTTGIVSAKDRTIEGDGFTLTNLIQTDAAINSGNSGGPLLNAQREVVGINTAKIADASNIGFALAIDTLRPLIDDLAAGNGDVNADQAFLGVSTLPLADADLPPEVLDQFGITTREGLIVISVTPGSAADEAGFQQGDIVLAVDGEPVDTNEALGAIIRGKEPGDVISVTRRRNGEDGDVDVTLQRRGG